MANATLVVEIVTKTAGAAAGLDAASGKFGKFGSAMKKAAVPAAAVVAGITAFGVASVQSASKLQQAMGGVDAVFGKNAGTVKKWAGDAAGSIGLAKSQYGELATLIGSQLKNAGLPMDQVTAKTKDLISTGADLAAMYGGTTADAVSALSGALKGEFDPLEKYGTGLSAAKIQAKLAAKGQDKLTGSALATAKAQATMALVAKQTADAYGAAAWEADTAAAKQQQLAATYENTKAALGTALLPVISKVMGALAKMAGWAARNKTVVQILAATLLVLAVAVLAVNAAMWVMAANPIVLMIVAVVAAVALLVIGFVLLWKKCTVFRKVVTATFNALKTAIAATGRFLSSVFSSAFRVAAAAARVFKAAAGAVLSAIRTAVGWVIDKVRALGQWFGRLKVPGVIRTVLSGIRTVAGWVIDKVKSLDSWLGRLSVPGAVKNALEGIKSAVDRVVGAVKSLIGWLGKIHVPKISLPGHGKSAGTSLSAGVLTARAGGATPRAGGTAATGGVVININGALDPEGVARQINQILGGHDRRVGSRRRGLRTA